MKNPSFPAGLLTIGDKSFYGCSSLGDITLPAGVAISSYAFDSAGITSITWPTELLTLNTYCFTNVTNLTSLNIPSWLTTIPEGTFMGCPDLASLTIASGVENVGKYAFRNCAKLATLNFPSNMTLIEGYAFMGCSSLAKVTLPVGVNLEREIFANAGLTELVIPEGTIGTWATNPIGAQKGIQSISFPSTMTALPDSLCAKWTALANVNLNKVQTIGAAGFAGCTALQQIDLPEGLQSIGTNGFASAGLTSIKIPSTLTEIAESVFASNAALTSVDLGTTLTDIGSKAFSGCPLLSNISFPASLKTIGEYAFQKCSALENVALPAGVSVGSYAFYEAGVKNVTFPETECTFGSYVFSRCSGITSMQFPDWMTVIPTGICAYCSSLETISYSDDVTTIGSGAFRNCGNLHDVKFPSNLKEIGSGAFMFCSSKVNGGFGYLIVPEDLVIGDRAFYGAYVTGLEFEGCPQSIGDGAFAENGNIQTIKFPDCWEEIPAEFCKDWVNLWDITLPSNLKKIGNEAFYGCQKITSFKFPETLESIGYAAFQRSGLQTIQFPEQKIEVGTYAFAETQITSIDIPEWMNSIPRGMCYWCRELTEINWPEKLTDESQTMTIGPNAFENCYKMPKIVMPPFKTVFTERLEANYDYMFSGAFMSCSGATEIVWSDQPVTLGAYTFAQSGVKNVEIPTTITSIPDHCFYKCKSLTGVTIPENVTSIGTSSISSYGSYAFGYTGLQTVNIPGSIAEIPVGCFAFCSDLESITLNEGLTTINAKAFREDSKLKHVTFPSTLATLYDGVFYKCTSLETVTSNATSLSGYTKATITGPGYINYSSLDGTFEGCTSLTSVTVNPGAHIEDILDNSFKDCTSLTAFNLPEGDYINTIGAYAFQNCTSLTTLPEFRYLYSQRYGYHHSYYSWKVPYSSYNFSNCSALKQVTMPDVNIPYSGAGGYTNNFSPRGYLNGATSLQSLIFSNTGNRFDLQAVDIEGAPLEALSYSYAKNILYDPLTTSKISDTNTIIQYTGNTDGLVANPETSIMYVVRGEKWKYIDANYDQLFTLKEMKDPQIEMQGDIISTYDAQENVNHYKVALRWQLPFSDLNENGETVVELYRNDSRSADYAKVADIIFRKPEIKDDVIVVNYVIRDPNGVEKEGGFADNFIYPETDSEGNTTYIVHYATTEPELYYNARTWRRLQSYDNDNSWFAFLDEFDSPVLSEPGVPVVYNYKAIMKGYDYELLVNNPDLEKGEDGKRYHSETISLKDITSIVHPIQVPIAVPTINFAGIYTADEIAADTDHQLAATPTHESGLRNYVFNYTIDEELMNQKAKEYGSTQAADYVITSIRLDELNTTSNTERTVATKTYGSTATGRTSTGSFTNSRSINVGNKYQTVTVVTFRGTFGSPVITVPDVPTFSATVDNLSKNDNQSTPTHLAYDSQVQIRPLIMTDMGYDEDYVLPDEREHYKLGLWRTVQEAEGATLVSNNNLHPLAELIYFDSDASAASDDDEPSPLTVHESNTSMVFSDSFSHASQNTFKVGYDGRLYVKVPEKMLRNDDAWMIADVVATVQSNVVSGVDGVLLDGDSNEDAIWYDLQGRRVNEPISGTPYIKVTSQGATKTIFR